MFGVWCVVGAIEWPSNVSVCLFVLDGSTWHMVRISLQYAGGKVAVYASVCLCCLSMICLLRHLSYVEYKLCVVCAWRAIPMVCDFVCVVDLLYVSVCFPCVCLCVFAICLSSTAHSLNVPLG